MRLKTFSNFQPVRRREHIRLEPRAIPRCGWYVRCPLRPSAGVPDGEDVPVS